MLHCVSPIIVIGACRRNMWIMRNEACNGICRTELTPYRFEPCHLVQSGLKSPLSILDAYRDPNSSYLQSSRCLFCKDNSNTLCFRKKWPQGYYFQREICLVWKKLPKNMLWQDKATIGITYKERSALSEKVMPIAHGLARNGPNWHYFRRELYLVLEQKLFGKKWPKLAIHSGSTRIVLIEPNRLLNCLEANRIGTDTARTVLRFLSPFWNQTNPNEPRDPCRYFGIYVLYNIYIYNIYICISIL